MKSPFILFLAIIPCLLLWASVAQARTLALSDLRKEVTLADPQLSPDGRQIALLIARSNFDTDSAEEQIVIVDAATGRKRALQLPIRGIASVRWSPSGNRIAFLASSAEDSEIKQIFTSLSTGAQLRKLTDSPQGAEYFAWQPDGAAIAYVSADSPPVRHGAAKYNTSFEVGDNDYLTTRPPTPSHLWLVSSGGGSSRRLTSGSWSLPSGSYSLSQPYLDSLIEPQHFPNPLFCWQGTRFITFTKMPDPYMSHSDLSVMTVLDTASGELRRLTGRAALEAGCDASPDGKKIAYWYPRQGQGMNGSEIFVTDLAKGGRGTDVTRALDRSPWVVRWMDDRSLLILAHDGTREGMWQVSVDGAVRRLDIGNRNASAASVSSNGAIAFIASEPKRPTELYYMSSVHATARRLTDYNGYFSTLGLGAVHGVEWVNDGFRESGVVTYPPDFVAGKKYPLVLQIHGWPQYASVEAFDTDYPGLTQLFAAHGYVVFEPNYRGSDNTGNAFESAIVGDSAAAPARDVTAGIDAVTRLGIVDSSKIAVTGWSYGGLLTTWLIGHSNRWKAAMAGAAPTNLAVDYAIGNYNVLDRHFYGRLLWQSKAAHQMYVDQSPLTYAWNMKTPTLIMSSTGDVTVPITHSYELYHALRDRGVPVSFVAYPSAEHFPSDPVMSEDIYRRWVGWLDKYLR